MNCLSHAGTQRLARQVGMGRAMELILGAHDFDADLAERYGSINRALNPDEIGPFVEELANRVAKFPAGSITACKRCVIKVHHRSETVVFLYKILWQPKNHMSFCNISLGSGNSNRGRSKGRSLPVGSSNGLYTWG